MSENIDRLLGRLSEAISNLRVTTKELSGAIHELRESFEKLSNNYNQLKGSLRTWKTIVFGILIPLASAVIALLIKS